ncbi:hypothetical protein KKG48_01100 [Patescibacteria group bacterium]|nr:hypothetical protein [Patescibacteria group bacterium]MCG2694949.1 hypothetical protein [Candidatus Parcubacteria bacterium]
MVVCPELEATGPNEYNIAIVEQWLDVQQKGGKNIMAELLYTEYDAELNLKRCLSLRDLEEISKKGGTFFDKNFKIRIGLAWKSVIKSKIDGSFHCPYLSSSGGFVDIHWLFLGEKLDGSCPAFRFKTNNKRFQ